MPMTPRAWRWTVATMLAAAAAGLFLLYLFDARLPDIGGLLDAASREIQAAQRRFHAELATAIRAVKANESLAFWNLVVLGFLYGVFHAAGPGHGKFVISTYLATSGARLSRGIALTFASSLVQGISAILVVEVTIGLLGLTFRDARQSAQWIETASYALVALLGIAVLAMALRRLARRHKTAAAGPATDEAAAHCGTADCDHDHGPRPADLAQPLTPARFIAIALSVGLRPCTGAVLVLLFARALELPFAGYGAVAGISLGTAMTVSALAILAVYARRTALALAGRGVAPGRLAPALDLVAAAGGLVIAAIGASLVMAALRTPSHPLL